MASTIPGILGALGLGEPALDVTNDLFSLAIMCYLSYFLYRKKILFKV